MTVRLLYVTALTTLFSYDLLFAFGQIRDFFRKILDLGKSENFQGYASICLGMDNFYTRWLYLRIQDFFGKPISSAPDTRIDVVECYSNDNKKTLQSYISTAGKTCIGVCELLGADPADADIMMGTFTKSFGSCGGYIATSMVLVDQVQHMLRTQERYQKKQLRDARYYCTS